MSRCFQPPIHGKLAGGGDGFAEKLEHVHHMVHGEEFWQKTFQKMNDKPGAPYKFSGPETGLTNFFIPQLSKAFSERKNEVVGFMMKEGFSDNYGEVLLVFRNAFEASLERLKGRRNEISVWPVSGILEAHQFADEASAGILRADRAFEKDNVFARFFFPNLPEEIHKKPLQVQERWALDVGCLRLCKQLFGTKELPFNPQTGAPVADGKDTFNEGAARTLFLYCAALEDVRVTLQPILSGEGDGYDVRLGNQVQPKEAAKAKAKGKARARAEGQAANEMEILAGFSESDTEKFVFEDEQAVLEESEDIFPTRTRQLLPREGRHRGSAPAGGHEDESSSNFDEERPESPAEQHEPLALLALDGSSSLSPHHDQSLGPLYFEGSHESTDVVSGTAAIALQALDESLKRCLFCARTLLIKVAFEKAPLAARIWIHSLVAQAVTEDVFRELTHCHESGLIQKKELDLLDDNIFHAVLHKLDHFSNLKGLEELLSRERKVARNYTPKPIGPIVFDMESEKKALVETRAMRKEVARAGQRARKEKKPAMLKMYGQQFSRTG